MKDVETEFCPIFLQQKGCLRLEVANERRLFELTVIFTAKFWATALPILINLSLFLLS